MKNPFSRAHEEKEVEEASPNAHLSIAELEKRTAAIEAEREQKRIAREERKFHKSVAEKRKQRERWIAPLLLLFTLLLSFLMYWRGR